MNKYRATPTVYGGIRYASKAEASRAQELDMLQQGGAVLWWIGQCKFRLGCPENVYVCDFLVAEPVRGGGVIIHAEDVKGHQTQKFKRDIKLWKAYGPMPLHVLSRQGSGWRHEIIEVHHHENM